MAPDARVISIRQTSLNYETNVPGLGNASSRARSAGNLSTLAQAVVRAADKGATVIEVSVTSCRPVGQITEDERELQAALRYAFETRNVVVVTPSGNTGAGTTCGEQNKDPNHPRTIITPAWFSEYVLSVAALKNDGGPIEESLHGPWVGVAAPGDGLTTLDPYDLDEISDRVLSMRGDVTPISGTTYASAYVAGLAALIREYRPELDARQVISRIKSTAIHPHSPGGWNDEVGFGMINPIEALRSESVPGE
jgi:membrane-anchored mycosin MYCP